MKTKTKTYRLISTDEGHHDYDVEVKKTNDLTVYTMKYSKSDFWYIDVRGTTIFTMIDDGNGIRFENKIKRKMDYFDFGNFSTFINFIMEKDPSFTSKYEILKSKY